MFHLVKPVLAQIKNPVLKSDISTTAPKTFFNNFIGSLFSIFFIVGVLYFAWHFIFAGYHWISAEGDSKKIEDTKKELTYAFVGLFTVFSVFAVLKVLGIVFGIPGLESLRLPLPTL
jgi:fumarate reductase subunit D